MAETHNGKGNLKDLWISVTEVIWQLVESDPAIAPAIYSWLIGEQVQKTDIPDQGKPSPSPGRIRKEIARMRERFLSRSNHKSAEMCDVLFVPNSTRTNLLGACIAVADSLNKKAPEIKSGFVVPAGHSPDVVNPGKKNDYTCYIYRKNYLINPGLLITSLFIFLRFRRCVRENQLVDDWFKKKRAFNRWRKILSSLAAVNSARRWLKSIGCKLVIIPNEQWPPASILVAAAKLEKINTCQILHGMPERFYWPFLSDEIWIWGPKTRKIFQGYGAPDWRLQTIGGLEFSTFLSNKAVVMGRNIGHLPTQNNRSPGNLNTLLFLSQWHGRKEIGDREYREIIDWIGGVLSHRKDNWQLMVRLHPGDDTNTVEAFEGLYRDYEIKVRFSTGESTLRDDILGSEFVCTHSSTGILMALLLKTRCALLWPGDRSQGEDEPFLDYPFLATSRSELDEILESTISDDDYMKSVYDLLGEPEMSSQKSSQRIVELLANR